jgi:hypothetical protein
MIRNRLVGFHIQDDGYLPGCANRRIKRPLRERKWEAQDALNPVWKVVRLGCDACGGKE